MQFRDCYPSGLEQASEGSHPPGFALGAALTTFSLALEVPFWGFSAGFAAPTA